MDYHLIRSRNRRRSIAMHIDNNGEVIVRAPVLMPKYFIDRFVKDHETWVNKQLSKPKKQDLLPKKKYFESDLALEDFITNKASICAKITGLNYSGIRFTNVKTYWGSCSPKGVISFNRHLAFAPREAIEYVIVHELCHLRYRGHGKRFWALVESFFPRSNDMKVVLRHISRG